MDASSSGRLTRAMAGAVAGAVLLALAPPALAQETETVGPPQLRDFRLDAPARRPVQPSLTQEGPVAAPPPAAPPQLQPAPPPQPQPAQRQPEPPPPAAPRTAQPTAPAEPRAAPAPAAREAPAPAEATSAPRVETPPSPAPAPLPQAATPIAPAPSAPPPAPAEPAPESGPSYLLWLLGAGLLALLGFAGLRARRRRPVPAPAPPAGRERSRPAAPISPAIAVDEPRPWLELDFAPQRASATHSETEVQFELVVRNGGKTDARAVRIEARMFNAAAEAEIEAFFAAAPQQQDGAGLAIPAGMEARARSQVMMPLESVRPIKVQDRSLFVPLVAFNVFYEWGEGRRGQTSRSWIVGREARPPADKMGAFRLDLGPRIYRQLGRRQHQLARVV